MKRIAEQVTLCKRLQLGREQYRIYFPEHVYNYEQNILCGAVAWEVQLKSQIFLETSLLNLRFISKIFIGTC